jgi:hypothetical protein
VRRLPETSAPQHPPIPPIPVALRTIDDVKPDYQILADDEQDVVVDFLKKWHEERRVAFAADLDSSQQLRGIAYAWKPGIARYFSISQKDVISNFRFEPAANDLIEMPLIGHDIKRAWRSLLQKFRNSVHSVNSVKNSATVPSASLRTGSDHRYL